MNHLRSSASLTRSVSKAKEQDGPVSIFGCQVCRNKILWFVPFVSFGEIFAKSNFAMQMELVWVAIKRW